MVDYKREQIPELSNLISKLQNFHNMKTDYMAPSVIFFISFDIVSSTSYKAMNPHDWSDTINGILRYIISAFEVSPIGGYSFWKSLGDEIVYTKEVVTITDLPIMLDEIYAILDHINHLISNATLCNEEASSMLGVKATAWIADVSSSAEYTRNVFSQFEIKDNRKQMDYAGPDIDTGFRISHYSMKNRFVISWGLSYLLLTIMPSTELEEKLHFITHKILDGVWGGYPYPIILYHANSFLPFHDTLNNCNSYKERFLQEYLEEKHNYVLSENSSFNSYVEKIIVELSYEPKLKARMEHVIHIIEHRLDTSIIEIAKSIHTL